MFEQARMKEGALAPLIHTDRGAAYTSKAFNQYLVVNDAQHSYSAPGTPADNAVITVKYEITTNNPDKEKPCHLNKVLGRNKLSFLSTADIHSLCFFGLIPPCVSIRRLKQTKFAPFYLTRQIFYRMQCILCISNLCALHSCSCIG